MTWLERAHRCHPPIDEIPADQPGLVRFWLCDDCGAQYRVTVGEHQGHYTDADGAFAGWTVAYSRMTP